MRQLLELGRSRMIAQPGTESALWWRGVAAFRRAGSSMPAVEEAGRR